MAKKEKKEKKKKREELDTETTVADMNVEGMPWYDPARKQGKEVPKLTKEEQKALIKGAYKAMFPMICCIGVVMLLMFFLARLWLRL